MNNKCYVLGKGLGIMTVKKVEDYKEEEAREVGLQVIGVVYLSEAEIVWLRDSMMAFLDSQVFVRQRLEALEEEGLESE